MQKFVNNIYRLAWLGLGALLLIPGVAKGQIIVTDPNNTGVPVPVPFQFLLGGIAGQSTITQVILGIIYIALAIIGTLAVLFIIIGGIRYVTSAGSEETSESAKKTILHSVIGLIIAILSFVIVRVISQALIRGNV